MHASAGERPALDRDQPGVSIALLERWPSPLGLRLAAGNDLERARRIVAVVADARDHGIDRAPVPTVYSCGSAPNPTPVFLVRTHGDPLDLAQTVRVTMREREPLRSVYELAPLEDRIGGAFAENRLRTYRAVVLCLDRTRARRGRPLWHAELRRQSATARSRIAPGAWRVSDHHCPTVLHSGTEGDRQRGWLGLAVSHRSLTRLLEGMLFGVSPTDPMVLAAVIAMVLLVATMGSLIPAVRASLIDPVRVLRGE